MYRHLQLYCSQSSTLGVSLAHYQVPNIGLNWKHLKAFAEYKIIMTQKLNFLGGRAETKKCWLPGKNYCFTYFWSFPLFKSHVCQNVWLLAISSGWVGVSIVGWRIMLKIGSKTSYILHKRSAVTRLLLQSRQNYFLWNLFFIFGLDPLTHICTLEKGESDSTLKFQILQLFCVSCDNLTSVFGWVNKTQFSKGNPPPPPSVLNLSLKSRLIWHYSLFDWSVNSIESTCIVNIVIL